LGPRHFLRRRLALSQLATPHHPTRPCPQAQRPRDAPARRQARALRHWLRAGTFSPFRLAHRRDPHHPFARRRARFCRNHHRLHPGAAFIRPGPNESAERQMNASDQILSRNRREEALNNLRPHSHRGIEFHTPEISEVATQFPPLPKGEGRGEGERTSTDNQRKRKFSRRQALPYLL